MCLDQIFFVNVTLRPPHTSIQHFQLSAAGFVVDASKKRGISGIIYSYKDWHIYG